jgi:aminoglycoside phosphotransferase
MVYPMMEKLPDMADPDQWAIIEVMGNELDELHVIPVEDCITHTASRICECNPARDDDSGDVFVHNKIKEHRC